MKGKVFSLLLSILVAFGIWSYVVTVVSPEFEATFYNIPVVLSNEQVMMDKGLMIVSDEVPVVTLQLRGNRSDLNKLKNSDITVVADLSKINSAGLQMLKYDVSFGGFGNSFEIVNGTPARIGLEIAEWDTKEVPVNVIYSGTLDTNYIAYKDSVVMDYNTVAITGPKAVVDQISQAVVDVNLDNQKQTINRSYTYTLCDKDGQPVDASAITTNVAQVQFSLKIQRVQEIQLLLNVTYGGGANAGNTQIVMSDQSIKVSAPESVLESLGTSLTIGSVNLADLDGDTVLTFPVTLLEGVENLSGINEVTVDISFPGLATKTINVSKIFVNGLPSNMQYQLDTKMVPVTVRGPEELVESIAAEHVYLLVNLDEAIAGENLYKAQVMFDTAYMDCGAIGSYSVLITLSDMPQGES